jgi:hypothetical protein
VSTAVYLGPWTTLTKFLTLFYRQRSDSNVERQRRFQSAVSTHQDHGDAIPKGIAGSCRTRPLWGRMYVCDACGDALGVGIQVSPSPVSLGTVP